MVKKRSYFKWLCSFLLIVYIILVCSSMFFSSSAFNKYLSTRLGIAHFFAFSKQIGILMIAICIVVIAKHFIQKRETDKNVLLLFVSLLLSALFVASAWKQFPKEALSNQQLKIVEWNCLNQLSKESAIKIFKEFDSDIIVLPEFGGYHSQDFSSKRAEDILKSINLDPANYSFFQSDPLEETVEGRIAPVTIITKKKLGYSKVNFLEATHFGTVYLSSKNPKIPSVVGLHTAPPLPGLMNSWKRDLEFISSRLMNKFPNALIIGDFNANLNHGDLSGITTHKDVINYIPSLSRGTWPSRWPPYFRSEIDHMLIPEEGLSINDAETVKLEQSDHTAIFATISIKP